jgi:hypothetical protein
MNMRWTRRLRRHGGRANIAAKRHRQEIMLLRAMHRPGKTADEARETLKWLRENEVRCLTLAEEERWRAHDPSYEAERETLKWLRENDPSYEEETP